MEKQYNNFLSNSRKLSDIFKNVPPNIDEYEAQILAKKATDANTEIDDGAQATTTQQTQQAQPGWIPVGPDDGTLWYINCKYDSGSSLNPRTFIVALRQKPAQYEVNIGTLGAETTGWGPGSFVIFKNKQQAEDFAQAFASARVGKTPGKYQWVIEQILPASRNGRLKMIISAGYTRKDYTERLTIYGPALINNMLNGALGTKGI